MDQYSVPKKNVREIAANPLYSRQKHVRLRVAAYCRVSTELEEQESSFEGQVTYYTNLIENNPEWEMAGIFGRPRISGIKDTTRPGFMQMIEACKNHKIDMILTKSLSRFSRNTLDSIRYIRLLKSLGVVIEFEKEGVEYRRSRQRNLPDLVLGFRPGRERVAEPERHNGQTSSVQGGQMPVPI